MHIHTHLRTKKHTYSCMLTQMRIHSGHTKIQNTLRKYNVLHVIVDLLEELERDIVLCLAFKDSMSLFTLAKVKTRTFL